MSTLKLCRIRGDGHGATRGIELSSCSRRPRPQVHRVAASYLAGHEQRQLIPKRPAARAQQPSLEHICMFLRGRYLFSAVAALAGVAPAAAPTSLQMAYARFYVGMQKGCPMSSMDELKSNPIIARSATSTGPSAAFLSAVDLQAYLTLLLSVGGQPRWCGRVVHQTAATCCTQQQ